MKNIRNIYTYIHILDLLANGDKGKLWTKESWLFCFHVFWFLRDLGGCVCWGILIVWASDFGILQVWGQPVWHCNTSVSKQKVSDVLSSISEQVCQMICTYILELLDLGALRHYYTLSDFPGRLLRPILSMSSLPYPSRRKTHLFFAWMSLVLNHF